MTEQHKLLNKWIFYFNGGETISQSGSSSLEEIHVFETIEQFWGLFQIVPKIEKLPKGIDIFIFKYGRHPNSDIPETGGKLRISFALHEADKMWETICALCLGEDMDICENIYGLQLGIGTEARFSIYFDKWDDIEAKSLKGELFEVLDISGTDKELTFFPKGGRKITL